MAKGLLSCDHQVDKLANEKGVFSTVSVDKIGVMISTK